MDDMRGLEPFEPILELPEIVGIVAVIFGGGFIIGKGNAHPPTLARVALRTKQAMRHVIFWHSTDRFNCARPYQRKLASSAATRAGFSIGIKWLCSAHSSSRSAPIAEPRPVQVGLNEKSSSPPRSPVGARINVEGTDR